MQAPVWRPFALLKEKVTCGVGLLNLLQFGKDAIQQRNRVLPLLVDEKIRYRILILLYGAKNQQWNMRAYVRYVPGVYGIWHAYKFVVTQTFRVFWPVLTCLWKDLLRPGSTILLYPKYDSYGESDWGADACDTQDTTPVSWQGTGCNCDQWL